MQRARRAVSALAAACLVFTTGLYVSGMNELLSDQYCFDAKRRPATTLWHQEELDWLPPGPTCRYFLSDGTERIVGAGFGPSFLAILSIVTGVGVLRHPSGEPSKDLD